MHTWIALCLTLCHTRIEWSSECSGDYDYEYDKKTAKKAADPETGRLSPSGATPAHAPDANTTQPRLGKTPRELRRGAPV